MSVEPVSAESLDTANAALCDGDGTTGFRTQVLYARASDVASRYGSYLPSFRQWASTADTIYNNSAAKTGGTRHIRFVHNANCAIVVSEVVLSPTGDDTFGNMVTELEAQGYTRKDRKYLVFMDAKALCGIGHIYSDDRASSSNYSNGTTRAMFSRIDSGCWGGQVAAHEHMHNLGGVQKSAPHVSAAGHCTDEYDVMCYVDGSGVTMQYLCSPQSTHEALFDCNNDDYFNTNPPAGSYLATYWNTANNQFLMAGGTAPPPTTTHDAQVVSVAAPTSVTQGTSATITVSVKNNGSVSESISVALSKTPSGFSQTKSVSLAAATSGTVTFTWATSTSTATGTHTFTATATVAGDSNNGNNTDTATTNVVSTPQLSVSSVSLTSTVISGGYQLSSVVSIQSGGVGVGGASVTIEYTDPNGSKSSATATTGTSGSATFSRSVSSKGTYTVTVTNVTKSGYTYNATGNTVSSTSITVGTTSTTPSMSVSSMTLSKSNLLLGGYRLTSDVSIKSGSVTVSNASVTVMLAYPNGSTYTMTETTNSSGSATFSRSVSSKGTYTVTVTNVTKSSYTYKIAGNVITSKSLTIS